MGHFPRWKRLALGVACMLLLTMSLPATMLPRTAFAQQETISINPTQGPPGTNVTVTGTGWTEHGSRGIDVPIQISAPGYPPTQVADPVPDTNGNFTATFAVPANVPTGQLTISAIIGNGGSADAWFTVTANAATVTVQKVWTADGNNNAKTTFAPGDAIRYDAQVTNSGSSTVTAMFTFLATGPQQIFSWSGPGPVAAGSEGFYSPSTVPTNAPAGTYTITVTVTYNGQSSTQSSQFLVETAPTPSPSPSQTPQPSPNPSPTVAQTPTSNHNSSSTPGPSPAGIPTPAPAPTPAPTPSSTPSTTSSPTILQLHYSNYAGYATVASAVRPVPFSDVRGSWAVPSLNCPLFSPPTPYNPQTVIWIGLGAFNPGGVTIGHFIAQIGIQSYCMFGKAEYIVVDEMVPFDSGSENIRDKPIKAGDYISAEVSYVGGTKYKLWIKNYTQGWTIMRTRDGSNKPEARYSAEWITEAPTYYFLQYLPFLPWQAPFLPPLAEFSTINFFDSTVDNLPISSGPIIDKITMQLSTGLVKAEPSALDVSGTLFSVGWKHF